MLTLTFFSLWAFFFAYCPSQGWQMTSFGSSMELHIIPHFSLVGPGGTFVPSNGTDGGPIPPIYINIEPKSTHLYQKITENPPKRYQAFSPLSQAEYREIMDPGEKTDSIPPSTLPDPARKCADFCRQCIRTSWILWKKRAAFRPLCYPYRS